MIIDSLGQEAKTNLKTERASFSVAADKAKKFLHIAVRNLYSNPVLASIVEVSQNAHDEHVRRGIKDTPFVVTIPTYWNPTFSVRDFGGGIPSEYMLDGYTKALESTKDADAEMSGGWGLGRLALLSLASTYNVTTYIDGTERNYSIFESENGIEIIMTHERETSEKNGTLVSAPIPPDKASQFRDCCNRAFRYYDVKPIIKGDSNFQILAPTYLLKGNGWAIEGSGKTSAVCGIYHYEIDGKNVPDLSSTQNDLLGDVGLVMFFGASELSPMANRQGLYYNDKTVLAIKKKLNEIEIDVIREIQKKFDECKSMFEAKLLWAHLFASPNSVNRVFKRSARISWNGIPIESNIIEGIKKIGAAVALEDNDKQETASVKGLINCTFFTTEWRRGRPVVKHYPKMENLLILSTNVFFINDLPGGFGAIRRAKSFIREKGSKCDAYVLSFSNDDIKQKFFEETHLLESDFVKISTVVPVVCSRDEDAAKRAKTKIFKWDGGVSCRSCNYSKHWLVTDIDLEEDEEGIYVEIDRFRPFSKGMVGSLSAMGERVDILRKLKFIDDDFELYGVRALSKECAAMKAAEGWISLDEFIADCISKYKISDEESQDYADILEYDAGHYGAKFGKLVVWGCLGEKELDSFSNVNLRAYLKKLLEMKKKKDSFDQSGFKEKHNGFVRLGGTTFISKKPSFSFTSAEKELLKSVPILEFVKDIQDLQEIYKLDVILNNCQKRVDIEEKPVSV